MEIEITLEELVVLVQLVAIAYAGELGEGDTAGINIEAFYSIRDKINALYYDED